MADSNILEKVFRTLTDLNVETFLSSDCLSIEQTDVTPLKLHG